MYYSRRKIALYAIPILIGFLLALPNLLSRQQLDALPDWLPKRQVALGLDLRGGSHLLLEIDTAALVQTRQEALADSMTQALRNAGIPSSEATIEDDAIVTTIRDPDRLEAAATTIRRLAASMSGDTPGASSPDIQVSAAEGKIRVRPAAAAVAAWSDAASEQSLEIVRRRVDETGVVEPTIMRQGDDRLVIQLPGVQDPGRIKALLGTTAKMSFHLLDESGARAQRGARLPAGVELLPSAERGSNELYAVRRRAMLEGDRLVYAAATFEQQTSEAVVTFVLIPKGRAALPTSPEPMSVNRSQSCLTVRY
jgi:protein-export membrane protein SecD